MDSKLVYGRKSRKGRYKPVDLSEVVGKTVEAVGMDKVEDEHGMRPMTVLYFSDGTLHGFVHPAEEE